MGFIEDFKQHILRNVMKDIEKEFQKTWSIDYKGHVIEIHHALKEEQLILDGQIVDRKQKNLMFYLKLKPYSTLSGTLDVGDGVKQKVKVRFGGLIRFKCVVKVGRAVVWKESIKLDFLPWNHKEMLVPFIEQQVQIHHRVMDDALPDDEYVYSDHHPRVAAGYADRHLDDVPTPFFSRKLLNRFAKQLHHPTIKTRKATYEDIIFDRFASYGGEFIERLEKANLDEALMQQEAVWLLEHAAHREVVKFAVMVLGHTNCEPFKERLCAIGMHEEFTEYVISALLRGTREPNPLIWKLAQSVQGWGKIEAVVQLEAATPEIKRWLLTKGCESTVQHGYLAYTCAVKGELASALMQETISKELYDGTGRIIEKILQEGDPDLVDYLLEHAILYRFVSHAAVHCNNEEDYHALMQLARYLADEEAWEESLEDVWKQEERRLIQQKLQPLIDESRWQLSPT
ncbi:hypothetical protein AWU65_09420 [Paenibacillus glucanolyticus]|uniref:Uncharacterized protein n=1 Tax=Paenibacillus glucanolyticus TaxID=59843 RepID=A0A163ISK9_9BACL|nr:hypothetical protein [Paenibacillus glucanolyticus]KZS46128.1 hypothetical protein AWU65_09420 [Paenibacillus glucanolyticus]